MSDNFFPQNKTSLFALFYILGFVILACVVSKYELQKVKKVERERNRIALYEPPTKGEYLDCTGMVVTVTGDATVGGMLTVTREVTNHSMVQIIAVTGTCFSE